MDIGIIIFLIFSLLIGFSRGIIKEGILTVGKIIALYISYQYHYIISDFLIEKMPFITFDKTYGLTSLNIQFYNLIGFVIMALVIYLIIKIILVLTGLLDKLNKPSQLISIYEKLGGLVVGFIDGYLLLFTILLALSSPLFNIELEQSKYAGVVLVETPYISDLVKKDYNLNKDLSFQRDFPNEYDEVALKKMEIEEYISKDLIDKLKETKKIEIKKDNNKGE